MLRRSYLCIYALCLMLAALFVIQTAHGEMSISVNSSLDSFSHDLEGMHLKLEKLDASWQLSPFGDGQLTVDKIRAKRLTITFKTQPKNAGDNALPERIKLPFPVNIRQAEVAELLLMSGDQSYQFNQVRFALEADTQTIHIKQLRADTPWGETNLKLDVNTLKPFVLSGEVSLKQSTDNVPYDVLAQFYGDLHHLNFASKAMLSKQAGKFMIHQQNQQQLAPAALVALNGQLDLIGDYPLAVTANISQLNPERLGDYPAAMLNFNIDLQGTLLPETNVDVAFKSHDSVWQNQPFTSTGKFSLTAEKIRTFDLEAAISNNHIKANGILNEIASRIEWQANLTDISKLGQGYSGMLRADGVVEGMLKDLFAGEKNQFSLQFNLAGEKLSLPQGLKIAQLNGQASMKPEADGTVTGEFKANGLQYNQYPQLDSQITLAGTKRNHKININAVGKHMQFDSLLEGGISENQWQGLLQKLSYTGQHPVQLIKPANLKFGLSNLSADNVQLQLTKGRALIDQLKFNKQELTTTGRLENIALDDLPKERLHLPDTLQGEATFSGRWDVHAKENLNGRLKFWKESGDLTLASHDGSQRPLGLETLALDIAITNNEAVLSTQLKGRNIGNAELLFTTILTNTDAGYALRAEAPLSVKGTVQLHTLALLPLPTSLMDATLDGELDLSVNGQGTLRTPNLSGSVRAKNLQFMLPSEGVALTQGLLDAQFENDQLTIQKASWQGGEGFVETNGFMRLDKGKPIINLAWNAQEFTVISRADRLLVMSGKGATELTDNILSISGNFTVNRGLAELANEDTPVLGDDVIILGQSEAIQERALQILLNGLRVSLGDDFRLRGRGLDAELAGALTFTGLTQYRPHTEGSIQITKGTYMAYGQVLTIERGIFNFNGTVDNPGINVRAMRNSKPVNAGVEITGSAQIPATKLVSDPSVSDSEKLSWLVLGHGMDQTTKNDYGLLSLAAGAILSQGQSVPLQTQIAHAAGLDELSFSGGDANSASLVFGKRLTSRLYLSYVKSISGLLDVARLTYNVTSRWSLRAEAGTESAVDVLYTFSFK